jgi:hypothetical protein
MPLNYECGKAGIATQIEERRPVRYTGVKALVGFLENIFFKHISTWFVCFSF